jgi:hypothetical protein
MTALDISTNSEPTLQQPALGDIFEFKLNWHVCYGSSAAFARVSNTLQLHIAHG